MPVSWKSRTAFIGANTRLFLTTLKSQSLVLWFSVLKSSVKLFPTQGHFTHSLTPDGIRAGYGRPTHKNLPVVVPAGMRNRHVINLLIHCPNRSRCNLDNFKQWALYPNQAWAMDILSPSLVKKVFNNTNKKGISVPCYLLTLCKLL